MATLKATESQVQRLIDARRVGNRKQIKKAVMAEIHSMHSIPKSRKIKIVTGPSSSPNWLVIRDKRTGQPLTNDLPDPVVTTVNSTQAAATAPAPAPAPVAEAKPAAKKVAAKKTASAKPAAKKAAPVKPAAKKVAAKKTASAKPAVKKAAPVKPAAKKVAAKKTAPVKPAAKKAPVKPAAKVAPVKPAAKAVTYPREVRVTINGKRVRLGTAKNAAAEKAMIAKAKNA
jgi:hypothetical protein